MTKRWLVWLFLISGCIFVTASATAGLRWPPGTLTGTVTDPDGRPLAGISLWAITSSDQKREDPPPSAVSGADGSFAIPDLPRGAVELYACGAGFLHDIRTVWFQGEPIQVELEPAGTVRGRVLGPDGAPVEDASIFARKSPRIVFEDDTIHSPFPESSPPCPYVDEIYSDADGRFELSSLPPGRYRLEIHADGLTTDEELPVRLSEGEVREGLEIRLRSDGAREIRLIDPAGAPPDSASVKISNEQGQHTTAYVGSGSFRLVPPGSAVTFEAEIPGYERLESTVDPVELDSEAPVELALVRDGSWKTVRGLVIGPDGTPIEGAEIYDDTGNLMTRSAADGSFELQSLPKNLDRISVSKDGFVFAQRDLDPEHLPVAAITFRLEPGAVVAGHVSGLTPGDRGLNARVSLSSTDWHFFEMPLRADDTFRFEDIPAGAWNLTYHARHRSVTKRIVVRTGQEVAANFSFPPLVPVSGQVLDDRGQPLAGAEVFASNGDETVASGGTRSDGRFTLYVPKGAVQLTAKHPGLRSDPLKLSVRRRPVRGLSIRLEPEPDPSFVATGRVLGLAPGQGAEVVGILDTPDMIHYSWARFEEDRFEVGLQPGSWELQGFLYDAAGHFLRKVIWTVEVPAESTSMEMELDLASAKEVKTNEPEEP